MLPYFVCSLSFYEPGKCLSEIFMINCISIIKKVKMEFMFSHNKKNQVTKKVVTVELFFINHYLPKSTMYVTL